jgi:hypothetical protein
MMRKRYLFEFLMIIGLLTACAHGSAATNSPVAATEPPTLAQPSPTLSPPTLESTAEVTPGSEATALPLATSRGPELHATDPMTVNLASGGLQFVEFFRFT